MPLSRIMLSLTTFTQTNRSSLDASTIKITTNTVVYAQHIRKRLISERANNQIRINRYRNLIMLKS